MLPWRGTVADRRARRSVRRKVMLVVLATAAMAMLVEGAAMLSHDIGEYRESALADLVTEASIVALSTAPMVASDDRQSAERTLEALQARSTLLTAALYDARGRLYAHYTRQGAAPPAAHRPLAGPVRISGESIEVVRDVVLRGKMLGTIYVQARYDITGRIIAYLEIFGLVTLMSLVVALVVSRVLQKGITDPLEGMADVAREVVSRKDYSLRARVQSPDQIGLVVEAFNTMLDEVQSHARSLEQSNEALKAEVAVRHAAEAALARATTRLQSTMAAAEIGGWVWELRTNRVTVDRNLAALLGVEDEAAIAGDPSLLRKHIHPEDLPRVLAAESEALRTGVLASTEYQIVRTDGEVRWVAGRGKVQLDAAGEPLLFAGLLIDITGQKLAEQALRDRERLYRAIGESMDYGVWVCDEAGRNLYASESFLRLAGITQQQCSDQGWAELLHPDDAQETIEAWRNVVASGRFWYREHRIRGVDGRYHPVLAQGVPIRDERGAITGWAGINLDISRLKLTEEALRDADRRKDEFLATLAHELRNPLAPIRHAVRLLEAPAASDRDRQWGREVIARQVQRMALLLDDLLDVSRITRGRLELKKDYVNLETLVSSAVETARPLIDGKSHALEIDIPQERLELLADSLRLSQALSNLLTNAAKYTDPGGRVGLRVALTADALVFTVSDTGIGFNQSAAPRLFDMFSQVDSAIDRAEGGLGIGLALVKGLISLHGGTVVATSKGQGRGSEFSIRLPPSVVTTRAPSSVPARVLEQEESPLRCKILVADDNRDAADSLAMLLAMAGHDIRVAHTGVEALALGSLEEPEAVILDIGMPGMTGFEVARQIRQEAWGRGALLIAVTGWGQEDDKEKTRAAGFDYHFTKPVDPSVLEGVLRTFLTSRRDRRLPVAPPA